MCVWRVCTVCVCNKIWYGPRIIIKQHLNLCWLCYYKRQHHTSSYECVYEEGAYYTKIVLWDQIIFVQNRTFNTWVCIWEERARWTKKIIPAHDTSLSAFAATSTSVYKYLVFIYIYFVLLTLFCLYLHTYVKRTSFKMSYRGTWHTSDTDSLNQTTSYRTVVTSRLIHCINVQFSYWTDIKYVMRANTIHI